MKNNHLSTTNRPIWRISQRLRKFFLTLHIGTSVGWLGAAIAMLVLITALVTEDSGLRNAAYTFMHIYDLAIMIPLGYLTFLTGIVLSLGTNWGLFKYYWIATKFVLTTAVLIFAGIFTQNWVREAITNTTGGGDIGVLGVQLVANAVAFTIVFWTTTSLSVYKPWGKIRDDRRKRTNRAVPIRISQHKQ